MFRLHKHTHTHKGAHTRTRTRTVTNKHEPIHIFIQFMDKLLKFTRITQLNINFVKQKILSFITLVHVQYCYLVSYPLKLSIFNKQLIIIVINNTGYLNMISFDFYLLSPLFLSLSPSYSLYVDIFIDV